MVVISHNISFFNGIISKIKVYIYERGVFANFSFQKNKIKGEKNGRNN